MLRIRAALASLLVVTPIVLAGPRPARAADDPAAEPPAAAPAELYEQTDQKKTIAIKLPRSWKSTPADKSPDSAALATFAGLLREKETANGFALLYAANDYSRATLARAVALRAIGPIKKLSLRQGPGWAEGCAINEENKQAEWRRYVEKGGRVYLVKFIASSQVYDSHHELVEKLLDTMTVPGEIVPRAVPEGFSLKKMGDIDVVTDAAPDRDASIKTAGSLVADAREVLSKALPGKPFDASRPIALVFQNAQKFEDRAKVSLGEAPKHSAFSPKDRAALVTFLGEKTEGYEPEVRQAGAAQYVWQYFGGSVPLWLEIGLAEYGEQVSAGGGKGKLTPEAMTAARGAVTAGKRRLDAWFDVVTANEIADNKAGAAELFAWQWYLRHGKGSKKYKKQLDGYIASLRETADPEAARKAFDGVDFDEMQKEFKAWSSDWK